MTIENLTGLILRMALIINKARAVAKAQGRSFSGSYTFDKAAQKLQGAKTL